MLVGNRWRGIDGLQGTFGMLLSMSVMLHNTCGIGNQPHQSTLHCDQMVHQANSLLKQKILLLLLQQTLEGSLLQQSINPEQFLL
jgi:hypothetical protein